MCSVRKVLVASQLVIHVNATNWLIICSVFAALQLIGWFFLCYLFGALFFAFIRSGVTLSGICTCIHTNLHRTAHPQQIRRNQELLCITLHLDSIYFYLVFVYVVISILSSFLFPRFSLNSSVTTQCCHTKWLFSKCGRSSRNNNGNFATKSICGLQKC